MNSESSSGLNSALNHVQYRNEMASLDPNDPELARKIANVNRKYGYGGSHRRHQYNNQSTQGQRVYHLKNSNRTTHRPTSSYQYSESDSAHQYSNTSQQTSETAQSETAQQNSNQSPQNSNQSQYSNQSPQYSNQSQSRSRYPRQHVSQRSQRPLSTNYLTNLFSPLLGNFNEHVNNVNNLLSRFQSHFENSNGPVNVVESTDFNPAEAYNTLVNNSGAQNGYTKYVSSFTSFDSAGQKRGATVSGVEKVVNGQRTVSKKIRRFENGVETVEQVFPDGRRTTTTRNLKQNVLHSLNETDEDTTLTETV